MVLERAGRIWRVPRGYSLDWRVHRQERLALKRRDDLCAETATQRSFRNDHGPATRRCSTHEAVHVERDERAQVQNGGLDPLTRQLLGGPEAHLDGGAPRDQYQILALPRDPGFAEWDLVIRVWNLDP